MARDVGRKEKVCTGQVEITYEGIDVAMANASRIIESDMRGAGMNAELKSVSHDFVSWKGKSYLTFMYVVEKGPLIQR